MDNSMSFIPHLKSFLLNNKFIYTVRKYEMDKSEVTIVNVGRCLRTPLGIIENKEDLLPYVKNSGFSSSEEWWGKIRYFIPNEDSIMYL